MLRNIQTDYFLGFYADFEMTFPEIRQKFNLQLTNIFFKKINYI
ncbi:MAG: hypothetical protein ACOCUV_02235 [bacterium]